MRDGFEIVFRIQIRNEPRLNRSPSQPFPRLRAGSRTVHTKERSDPPEMIGGFLTRFSDDRYVQVLTDDLSDVSSRHAFVGQTVITASSRTLLQYEPVEMTGIEPMYCRPTVESLSYIRGNSLFPRDADQVWDKSVIAFSVYRWREA
jgi:hypothetical protein